MGKAIERVAFDIGGTFTDVVALMDDGHLYTAKTLSLLDSVGTDIRKLLQLDQMGVGGFIHGTTVAANALLEGKLARVGLITTEGFRDVLEMRCQRRPNIYDFGWERSPPLVPRYLRLEIAERIRADGGIERPIRQEDIERVVGELVQQDVEAIALCLINAYANPVHEQAIADYIRSHYPGMPVCVSSEEFPEIREYERTSTTAVNSVLTPVVDSYLTQLQGQLEVPNSRLLIMQSNGGVMDAAVARRRPVQMVESGPAAGVLAAATLAREIGLDNVLAFDMGGTTAKATLIENGTPLEKPGGEVGGAANLAARFFGGSGHAIRVPAFDIAEVGAGGGSIAWIDSGGALRVGPQGAGAQPGPVCYGRGGEQPTVTDANVVLGIINPRTLAGTTVGIDAQAAARAIATRIAEPLGLSLMDAAHGIVRVANATTIRALRSVSIERGVDPRTLTMLAFGGSGPVHAADLASALGVATVYIPPFSGIFSAVGLLVADYRYDLVRSTMVELDRLDAAHLRRQFAELEKSALQVMRSQGLDETRVATHLSIDIRYRHQDMPLTLAMPPLQAEDLGAQLSQAFSAAHQAAFGYARDDLADIVALRLRVTGHTGAHRITEFATRDEPHSRREAVGGERPVYWGARAGLRNAAIVDRAALDHMPRPGPLIVEEWDTSTAVPPGWAAHRDGSGNIVLTSQAGGRP